MRMTRNVMISICTIACLADGAIAAESALVGDYQAIWQLLTFAAVGNTLLKGKCT